MDTFIEIINPFWPILVGLLVSLYPILIVARYSVFRTLREQACWAARPSKPLQDQLVELSTIADSFERLRYTRAANRLRAIAQKHDESMHNRTAATDAAKASSYRADDENSLRAEIEKIQPSLLRVAIFPFIL